jgi:hypothetical protein
VNFCTRHVSMVVSTAIAASAMSCGEHDASSVTLAVPSRDGFGAVSAVLEPNCGTLDCHGDPARNFRVYGKRGLRLDGNHVTGAATDTTQAEVDATYASIIGLQPEMLNRLYIERGREPHRWLVVSKARGSENHIGKDRLPARSPGDRCVVSWASGMMDVASCSADAFGPVPRPGEVW